MTKRILLNKFKNYYGLLYQVLNINIINTCGDDLMRACEFVLFRICLSTRLERKCSWKSFTLYSADSG